MDNQAAFLVTTSRSVILLDGLSASGFRITSGKGLYYGIARDADFTFVAARNRLVSSTVPIDQERGEILAFDGDLNNARSLKGSFALRDIHQILAHEGKLWVTCAFDNMIAIYNGRDWVQWHPCGNGDKQPADVNHFNSLSVFGNELCVVAHNHGPSDLMFFELPDLRPSRSVTLGHSAHNAWLHQEELMTCSSEDGCILGVNGTRVETGGFPRGIAYVNDEIYVGVSERAERGERDFSNANILVFDRRWHRVRSIALPGEGMVLDIMPIDPKVWPAAVTVTELESVNLPVSRLSE